MAFRTKPDMTAIWASLGDNTKPVDSYITNGWEAVKPPRQYFNWLDNRQDSALAYIYQAGIVQWDALTDYEGGAGNTSYVQGSDGLVYKAVADSGPNISGTGTKDPVVQPGNAAFWTLAFASQADIDLVEADVATLETQMGDGSGVTNAAAWRTALSVDSSSQVDAKVANILSPVAIFSFSDTTKNADLLGNVTLISANNATGLNQFEYVLEFSGLPAAFSSTTGPGAKRNFQLIAGSNIGSFHVTAFTSNQLTMICEHANNTYDTFPVNIEGSLYFKQA